MATETLSMKPQVEFARPIGFGALAFGALLAVYFGVLTLVSGWRFTVGQFADAYRHYLAAVPAFIPRLGASNAVGGT